MRRTKRKRPGEREFNSTLPVWIISRGEKDGTLNMECPRCEGKLIVSRKKLADGEAKEFIGRSCIYCFRVSRLPEKYMNKSCVRQLEIGKPYHHSE